MRLNNTELAQLRQKPQSTHLNLSIFQPTIIFQAQVNNTSAAKGDRVIPYDSVSLGSYTAIEADMTMWIGTTPGAMDVGKIRVRSATSTTITVSENSDISWADNLYLTVFRYWELWPVYPRIILDPANNENVIFYKDYDIPYTNQNSVLGTFVNAGPHRAIFLDPASNQAQIYYSSTGTYNVRGSTLYYNWFFEGATVTGSTSADPGYVTYNTPGHYVTRLNISGSNGEFDSSYRYVSVYNSANPPIQKWQLSSLQGSRDEGGYSASFKVFEIIPIQEHAVVVLFGQNQYGNTQVNLGGNFPNSGDIFFVGYINKDSIQYDYEHSEVSFDATSMTEMMKKSTGFSVSVQSVASPTKWYELLDMDSTRAIYHYLRWHTTALKMADFQYVGNDYKVQYFDSDRESMYDAITNYMQNSLVGKTVSDRQGKVWMEVDAAAYPNPTGTFFSVMDISRNDWMNTPTIEERLTNDVAYMEYGGVQFSGVNTGTFAALIAAAPGSAPGFYGSLENHQGLVLGGQPHLNQILGNVYANKNSQFPNLGMDMSINTSNLDIAPQESVEVHIAKTDTVRNITIDGLYIPESMSWKYNPEGFSLLPTTDFRELVNGEPAETVVIPNISEVGNGFVFDPFSVNFPPLPVSFPPTTNSSEDLTPQRVLIHDTTAGLVYTTTFNTGSPNWYQVNGGLTATQYQAINRIVVCPNGAIYVGYIGRGANSFLARAPSIGSNFTIIEDYTSMVAKYSGSTDNVGLATFNNNTLVSESVMYVLTQAAENVKIFTGAGSSFTAGATFVVNTNNFPDVSYGASYWMFTSAGTRVLLSTDGITIVNSANTGAPYYINRHFRIGTTANVYLYGGTGGAEELYYGENNFTSITLLQATNYPLLAIDSGGSLVMSYNPLSLGLKSSDGGYSFSNITMLPVLQTWAMAYAGGTTTNSRWIAVSQGGYIYYTDNFWISTPDDKRGNITQITAIPFLDIVKYIG